jgi:hypothetical protein
VPPPIRNVAREGLIEEGHELIDEIEKAQCWVLAL